MAATIKVLGKKATISKGAWSSDDPHLTSLLNAHLSGLMITGLKGYIPNLDLSIAEETIREFGGELLTFDEVKIQPGIVY
jgi:hypothetical protein